MSEIILITLAIFFHIFKNEDRNKIVHKVGGAQPINLCLTMRQSNCSEDEFHCGFAKKKSGLMKSPSVV